MASTDSSIINTRERPLSTDIMNVQNMLGRTILDIWKFAIAESVLNAPGTPPGWSPVNVVLNGLVVSPGSTGTVAISAGALIQNSPTLSPPLGALDSTYRIGINRDSVEVAIPTPPSTSYCLIEAQMVDVVTNTQSRDRFDIPTESFQAVSLTKLTQREVQFQVTTNPGSIPDFSGNDWVPIAAVKVDTSGSYTSADIIDLRPMWSSRLGRDNERVTAAAAPSGNPRLGGGSFVLRNLANIELAIAAYTEDGARMWASGELATTDTAFQEGGLAYLASTWYYVYLSPFRGSLPVNAQGIGGRGVVVISANAPANGTNSAPLTLPAPFDLGTVPIGAATCIAAIRRNGGNTGFVATQSSDGHTFLMQGSNAIPAVLLGVSLGPTLSTANDVVPAAGSTPTCAKATLVTMRYNGGDSSPTQKIMGFGPAGGGATAAYGVRIVYDDVNTYVTAEIPVEQFQSDSFSVVFTTTPDAASTISVIGYYGWRM